MAARKRVLNLWGFAGVLAVAATTAVSPAMGARTLVDSPTTIKAFAQDGHVIAWGDKEERGRFGGGRTFIRNLTTGSQRSFALSPPFFGLVLTRDLALAHGRALWSTEPLVCSNCAGVTMWTATVASPQAIRQKSVIVDADAEGRRLTGVAGGGRRPAFSWLEFRIHDPACMDDPSIPCVWDTVGGAIERVRGRPRNNLRVPGSQRPALLAAGAGRLAYAPARTQYTSLFPLNPAVNGPVNVIEARSGAPVVSVSPVGTVRGLALSDDGKRLAVLVRQGSDRIIERYAIPSGTLLTSTTAASGVLLDSLGISRRAIV